MITEQFSQTQTNDQKIAEYFKPMIRGIELLNKGDFNFLILISKSGYGKSFQVDRTLKNLNAKSVVFQGEITEPKFFEFLEQNKDGKIIVFRDLGKIMRSISFIDTLKHLTAPEKVRKISRLTYANHKGVSPEFDFTSRIIIELNEIGKNYPLDIEALKSRGLYIELNFSIEDLKNIMRLICKNKEQIEITEYLFTKLDFINNSFNLRTHFKTLRIAEAANRDNLEPKKEIDMYLNSQIVESKKLLFRLAGNKPIRRMIFVKYLISQLGISLSSAQRKINSWLETDEIYSNGLEKQANLCIKKQFKQII